MRIFFAAEDIEKITVRNFFAPIPSGQKYMALNEGARHRTHSLEPVGCLFFVLENVNRLPPQVRLGGPLETGATHCGPGFLS